MLISQERVRQAKPDQIVIRVMTCISWNVMIKEQNHPNRRNKLFNQDKRHAI